jgi:spermidine/putrescine transport system substrate-binding protein
MAPLLKFSFFLDFKKTSFGAAALLMSLYIGACTKNKEENVLNLAIWGNYLSPELSQKFQQETGIQIKMTHYSSNEELLAKVQTGGSQIDVAVPSDYMVGILRKMDLLETLDKSLLPHISNLEPRFLNQDFDPENKYSIPYGWTTSGIAIHKGLFKGQVESWKDLFENPALKGQVSALDDMRELAAAALKIHKRKVNTGIPAEIEESFQYLKKFKSQVKVFTANAVDLLKNKEIKAGHVYSSDALLAQKEDSSIDFVIPIEGSTQALDNLVIIKSAPHKKAAHVFLNFMMTQEAAVQTVLATQAGPVVKGVRNLLPAELKNNKSLFPEASLLDRLERIQDLGEQNSLYEDAWTDFKSM